ncbi:MAG: helix-turn-helix transcriptional regulator [Chloroflexi bacterium]|nr:helix-turn-helix transcriptional regulator [Chloroflexota bacterium]
MADRANEPFATLRKRHRLAAGLTQEDVAERAGISARAVSDLELGGGRTPRLETVGLLAAALGLSVEQRASVLAAAPPASAATTLPSRLPDPPASPTPLIGREGLIGEGGRTHPENRRSACIPHRTGWCRQNRRSPRGRRRARPGWQSSLSDFAATSSASLKPSVHQPGATSRGRTVTAPRRVPLVGSTSRHERPVDGFADLQSLPHLPGRLEPTRIERRP